MSRTLLLAAALLVAIASLPQGSNEVPRDIRVALSPGHVTNA